MIVIATGLQAIHFIQYIVFLNRRQFHQPGRQRQVFQEGMVMCVEALIGVEGGRECVKLEEQVLITADGYEQLTTYPLEDDWV